MPEFKPYLHCPCETKKVLAQNNSSSPVTGSVPGPDTSKYLKCPLGAPCPQSFPLYPRRGVEIPPLPCCQSVQILLVWRGVWWQQFQPRGLSGLQDAVEDGPGALWHQQTGETWHVLFLIQNAWSGLFPAEILPWPLFQVLHSNHLQLPL